MHAPEPRNELQTLAGQKPPLTTDRQVPSTHCAGATLAVQAQGTPLAHKK